jgi:hypothetical protein
VTRALLVGLAAALALSPAAGAATGPAVRASLAPASAGLGDPLLVQVEVALTEGLDAGEVRVEIRPGPLTALTPPTVERLGGTLRVSQRLACLSVACVPGERGRSIAIPAPRVVARGARAEGPPLAVRLVPRVPAREVNVADPRFRRTTTPPGPSYRVSPDRLAAALVAIAAVLAVVAAALIVSSIRRARRPAAAVDPLARALRLVRESVSRPPPDRRRAAGLLSRVLAERGAGSLAGSAGALAWSAPQPEPAAAEALAERVEGGVEPSGAP